MLCRPLGTRRRVAAHLDRREPVEEFIVCRVYGDQLPFQMGRKFRDHHAFLADPPSELVAVLLTLGCKRYIDERGISNGYLNADKTEFGRPFGDRLDVVERLVVRHELR